MSRSCHFIIEFNDGEIKVMHKSKSNPTVFSQDGKHVVRENRIKDQKIISETDYLFAGEYKFRFEIVGSPPPKHDTVTDSNSPSMITEIEIVEPDANSILKDFELGKMPTSTPVSTMTSDDDLDLAEVREPTRSILPESPAESRTAIEPSETQTKKEPELDLDFVDSIDDDEFAGDD